MKNSGGQIKKKKYNRSIKQTPTKPTSHPWTPSKTQITVKQVCQYLELNDYPIPMNEFLRKKFEDYKAFDDYARPLFRQTNPCAHPLTLATLLKAKWFEVLNP